MNTTHKHKIPASPHVALQDDDKIRLIHHATKIGPEWRLLGLILGLKWNMFKRIIPLTGHWEFLRQMCGLKRKEVNWNALWILVEWTKSLKISNSISKKDWKILNQAIALSKDRKKRKDFIANTGSGELLLYNVAEDVGNEWEKLAKVLNLDSGVMDEIRSNSDSQDADTCMDMLHSWARLAPNKSPRELQSLLMGLRKIDKSSLARELIRRHIKKDNIQFPIDEQEKVSFLNNKIQGNVCQAVLFPEECIRQPVAVKRLDGMHSACMKNMYGDVEKIYNIHSPYTVDTFGDYYDNQTNEYRIVMEYMSQGSLSNYLMEHLLDWDRKMEFAADICRGMAYLHGQGVIHGDLKADNVYLTHDMRAKISAFGYPWRTDARMFLSFREGRVPTHSAPELLDPLQEVTWKIDVYSFGILLFELAAERMRDTDSRYNRLPYDEDITAEKIRMLLLTFKMSPITDEMIRKKIHFDCPILWIKIMKDAATVNPRLRNLTFEKLLVIFAKPESSKIAFNRQPQIVFNRQPEIVVQLFYTKALIFLSFCLAVLAVCIASYN